MELTFIPFEKKHYLDILPYFDLRPTECCESQLLYHVIWENYYKPQFCISPTGVIWYQKVDKYQHAALLPVSKKEDLRENFQLLQEHFTKTLHAKLVLFLVDEEALEAIAPDESKYEIIQDVDSSDYIYDTEKLKTLAGRNYHKKKNHVNGFLKEYGDRYEYRKLTDENADEILTFSNEWFQSKVSEDELNRLESEEIGLKNLLDYYSYEDIRMAGIYIDNKLEAFTAGIYNASLNMAVVHFEKANNNFRGLYPFINQQFLIHEFPDVTCVNREDDMGIPSLRKAKEAYYPIRMTKKYTIYEK